MTPRPRLWDWLNTFNDDTPITPTNWITLCPASNTNRKATIARINNNSHINKIILSGLNETTVEKCLKKKLPTWNIKVLGIENLNLTSIRKIFSNLNFSVLSNIGINNLEEDCLQNIYMHVLQWTSIGCNIKVVCASSIPRDWQITFDNRHDPHIQLAIAVNSQRAHLEQIDALKQKLEAKNLSIQTLEKAAKVAQRENGTLIEKNAASERIIKNMGTKISNLETEIKSLKNRSRIGVFTELPAAKKTCLSLLPDSKSPSSPLISNSVFPPAQSTTELLSNLATIATTLSRS